MRKGFDLVGKRFGRLTVIRKAGHIGKKVAWYCKCDCGGNLYPDCPGEIVTQTHSLTHGLTTSCGCVRYEKWRAKQDEISAKAIENHKTDLLGRKFYDLTPIENLGDDWWLCRCKCGNLTKKKRSTLLYADYHLCCESCNCKNGSEQEREIFEYINSIYDGTVIQHETEILDGKEIDIYIPELKLGIEYNGSAYHATIGAAFDSCKSKLYHQQKFIGAKRKGIHLISIFDVDYFYSKDKILTYLCRLITGSIVREKPTTLGIITNNDYDDGEWLRQYGYKPVRQIDPESFMFKDHYLVYRSGKTEWIKK